MTTTSDTAQTLANLQHQELRGVRDFQEALRGWGDPIEVAYPRFVRAFIRGRTDQDAAMCILASARSSSPLGIKDRLAKELLLCGAKVEPGQVDRMIAHLESTLKKILISCLKSISTDSSLDELK